MRRLTHEEYIEKWKEKVKNPNYKIIGKYKNNRTPILVKNKYGECLVRTENLLKGAIPTIQTAINKTEYCINQFKEVHGNKYDYYKVEYIKRDIKVIIICPKHGEFKQNPYCHNIGQGCKECKRYSRLDWVRSNTKKFINDANKVHKNLYDYSATDYVHSKKKVIIICKSHGKFMQSPNSHLKGRGCPKCFSENNGYNKSKFVYFAKNRICKLYLIECYNENEKFIKVGITSHNLKKRFNDANKLPYNYKKILVFESSDASFIWEKEVELKKKFRKYRYTPLMNFKGYTECFHINKIEEIKEFINNLN